MQRKLFFIYGVGCHALFLIVYAWMAVFVGNFAFGLLPVRAGIRAEQRQHADFLDLHRAPPVKRRILHILSGSLCVTL